MKKLIATLMLSAICTAQAFADKVSDYKEYASRVRAEVWADSLPGFINPPAVPEKYKNESAVILATHNDIFAKKKTGVGFDRNASLIPIKRVALINMDDYKRSLIQINDKAALEAFSEYDIPIKSGSSDWFWQEKDERKYVLGVRIIKPDGKIIEVPTDDFILASQQKDNKNVNRQKLAVPGLEIGDRLDIFIFTHTALKNIQPEPVYIFLRKEYPVLSQTISCKIDDDLSTVYAQRNGAPDLKVEQGPDKDYIITGEITEPYDPEPKLNYISPLQSPFIEMLIYNRRFDEYTPRFARKDGVQANPDQLEGAVKDRILTLEGWSDMTRSVKEQLGSVKGNPMKAVKQKFKNGEWTQARTADYVYNLLVFSYMTGKYRYYPGTFVNELYCALDQAGIKNIRKGVTTSRYDGSIDKTLDYNDIWYFVYLPETGQIFSNAFRGYNTSSEIPTSLQGQKGLLIHDKKLSKKERESEDRWLTIPLNSPEMNREVITVDATIDGTDMNIIRRVDAFGASKNYIGPLLTGDDMLNAYLNYLNRDGIVADPQMLRKEKAKDKQARMERNADAAKEQLDDVRLLIEKFHGSPAKEFKDYEILSAGIGTCPDSSGISYTAGYTMDGLVKRAGRNLIVNIGKLIGESSEIAPSQRKRRADDDILSSFPQKTINHINIVLPEGYKPSAQSLAKLNVNVSNSVGSFISKAEVKDGRLEVTVSLEYPHIKQPGTEWNNALAIADAKSRYNTLTLLLEKK